MLEKQKFDPKLLDKIVCIVFDIESFKEKDILAGYGRLMNYVQKPRAGRDLRKQLIDFKCATRKAFSNIGLNCFAEGIRDGLATKFLRKRIKIISECEKLIVENDYDKILQIELNKLQDVPTPKIVD